MNKIYQYCYQTEAGRVAKYMAHKTVSAESRDIDALSFFSIFLGLENFTYVKPCFVDLILLTLTDLCLYPSLVEKKLTDIYQYSENSRCSYTVDLCKAQSTETR